MPGSGVLLPGVGHLHSERKQIVILCAVHPIGTDGYRSLGGEMECPSGNAGEKYVCEVYGKLCPHFVRVEKVLSFQMILMGSPLV